MRLTQIRLAGFKSFVDPTIIPVPGQLVAVIGPNGCGKSNVIDAVRWVLGESSARQLRGSSMQDVIFNGSGERRPACRASVELVFDNSDHQLSGPWGQYAEVSIKRVLTRQSDASYYINNQQVRRRDITDLFLGTGVGTRGYAVIEQGMISRIIEAKPEELRSYLEEAAGISKYKERRRETELRLNDTRENLTRVDDLQQELQRQIGKLNDQAAVATRYHELKSTVSNRQNLLIFLRREEAVKAEARARAELARSETQELFINTSLNQGEQRLYELRTEQKQANESVQQAQQVLAEINARLVRLEEQQRHCKQQRQRLQQEMEQIRHLRQRLASQKQQNQQNLEVSHSVCQQQRKQQVELCRQLNDLATQLPQAEHNFRQSETTVQQLQTREYSLIRERDLHQQKLLYLEKNRTEEKLSALTHERQAINLPTAEQIQVARRQVADAEQSVMTTSQNLQIAEQTLHQLRQQQTELDAEYRAHNQAFVSAEAQANALAAVLARQHGDETLSDWLQQYHLQHAPQLWQHVRVESEWQNAFETILGERLYALAAECPSEIPPTTLYIIDQSSRELLSLTHHVNTRALLLDKVIVDPLFEAALTEWLKGIYCAQCLEIAIQQRAQLDAGECWLTPEGHRITLHCITLNQPQTEEGMLAQKTACEKARMKAIEYIPLLEQNRQCQADIEEKIEAMSAELATQRDLLKSQQQDLQHKTLQEVSLTQQFNHCQVRLSKLESEIDLLTAEQAMQQQEKEAVNLLLEEVVLSLEEMRLSDDDIRQQKIAHEQQLLFVRQQISLLEKQQHQMQLSLQQNEYRLQDLQRRQHELSEQEEQAQERVEQLTKESELVEETENQSLLDALLQKRESAEAALAASRENVSRIEQIWQEIERQQQSLKISLPEVQAARQQWLLKAQEAQLLIARYQEALEENNVNIEQLEQQAANAPKISLLSSEISQLTAQIDTLGAVNLAALEELASAQERSNYLLIQSEDLQHAMKLLEDAMTQIDGESRTMLKNTFDAVNAQMKAFFPSLFGGGQAELVLTGEDLLDAGVQIIAHPPGKKNSTIHLLSGGEKALTAMSLVFSLFALNPAPFCLLDEVDAPLDDANTSRFCNLVKQMSIQTQFLYISHNRLTMEMAEQLIGVTMQEQGVSRIVAVDIVTALEMGETIQAVK